MSDGIVHFKSSLILASGFSLAALATGDARILECTAGALVGIFISPDLDLNGEGIVQGRFIRRKFGNPVLGAWKRFWQGYSGSFKHGQFGSHFPIYSTFVRLSYIYFWTILIPHILIYFSFYPSWSLMYVLSWYAILFTSPWFFLGLAYSDFIHYALDKVTTKRTT